MGEPAPVPPEPSPAPAAAQTPVSGRADFSARLDGFQGPLDLLLYLIRENEVEITAIPIARLLEQYLAFLESASSLDLHLAGEFLVMAATLMEIKSRELLPAPEPLEGEEIIEDPRSELVRQLLRYRRLKDQARYLEERREFWAKRYSRGQKDPVPERPLEEPVGVPPGLELDLYDLLVTYERLRRAVLAAVPRQVHYEGENLEEKLVRIERLLREHPFTHFSALITGAHSRAEIALTFVALLELVRRRMIRLLQEREFGTISVQTMTPQEAEELARREADAANAIEDAAAREKVARDAALAQEAAALGVRVDQLPWKRRHAAPARPKFEGLALPEDVEELDAEEAEIARRIDAILAAADAVSQRFEASQAAILARGAGLPPAEGETALPPAAGPEAAAEEKPLTEADLAPVPETPPEGPGAR